MNNNAAKNLRAQSQIENIIQSAKQSTVSDKPMNIDEKNSLKNSIGNLTEEQQRGIINLVQDCLSTNGGEVFEFELD
jgi:Bromodomain extra-terminal - transcription regulation